MKQPVYVGSLFSGIGGLDLGLERAGMEIVFQCELDPQARRILAHHWPNAAIYHDVHEVTRERLEADLGPRAAIAVLVGGWPCFVEGTMVLTQRGLIPIEDVVVGDHVTSHQANWCEVTATRTTTASTVVARGYGHPGLECTGDHRFWCADGWVPAKEMEGAHWSSLVQYPALDVPPIAAVGRERSFPQWSAALAAVVGRWVGDGWAFENERRGGAYICCAHDETDEVAVLLAAADLRATVVRKRTTTRFVVSSRPFARWLRQNFGHGAAGKTFPGWIFADPHRGAFFEGYLGADGSGTPDNWKLTTVSKALAVGARMLALSLGQSVSMYVNNTKPTTTIEGRVVRQRPWWQVDGRTPRKPDRRSYTRDIWRFGSVTSVEATAHERTVVDLTVRDDESFLADGVAVHNCQDISLAGGRRGLAGERSGLFSEFVRVVDETTPRWVLAENVAGLLTSYSPTVDAFDEVPADDLRTEVEETYDLGAVITTLSERGYVGAWRVCDSRGFGVPQRRRRIFLVGHLGGTGAEPAAVLFEPEILPRDPTAGDEAPEAPAGDPRTGVDARGRGGRGGGPGTDEATGPLFPDGVARVPQGLANDLDPLTMAGTLGSIPIGTGHRDDVETSGAYIVEPFVVGHQFHNETARTLTAPKNGYHGDLDTENLVVDRVFRKTQRAREKDGQEKWEEAGESNTLTGFDDRSDVRASHLVVRDPDLGVRRLTPLEYERLQNFPDHWTALATDPKPMSDSARYRLVGNSVTVCVSEYIGRRLAAVHVGGPDAC